MKTYTALAASLALGASANAATIAYSYKYDLNPGHNGGTTIYADDLHADNGGVAGTTFDSTGDLNDAVTYNGTNPVTDGGGVNSMVGWSTADNSDTPATITVDLGGLYDLTQIDLTTYAWSAFNLGAPDDVTISTSVDDVTYGGAALHLLADGGDGSNLHTIARADSGIRYIQLAFDGDETVGDKWGLTELRIDGAATVPEPSSMALLGLGGLALLRRRRK